MQNEYTILSVGGSIIIPKTGFDIPFLKNFRTLILNKINAGQKLILVIGGGGTCRTYQNAAKEIVPMTNEDLDWLGIKTTVFNAEFVKALFKDVAHEEVITNPTKKIRTKKSLLIAAGWKPGCSTDNDAVLLAKTYGVKKLFNLSNIDFVYDSDPATNPNAQKFDSIAWSDFRRIVGDVWQPGANVPFDPVAAQMAQKLQLTVGFIKGTDLAQVEAALDSAPFAGTTIHP